MSEQSPWPMAANRTQGLRAVGGKLHVDRGQLRFEPNGFDAATGGQALAVGLDQVAEVGTEPAAWRLSNLFSGGLRTRLAVDLADGSRELFVVWDPVAAADQLRAVLESR